VNAVGLSGLDGRIWEGPRKDAIRVVKNGRRLVVRDDYTGRVERVNTALLLSLIESGLMPVLTPPAASTEGEAINVDGDRAAALTAAALGAHTLVILSDVPGLLERFPDEGSLIPRIRAAELAGFMALAEGRMKKKVLGAEEALSMGVHRVIFADGRVEQPLRRALEGHGTMIGD
jgi:acetylglutamate/LysW-gamma-L-alpha-aminoadipate kinase